MGSQVIVQSVAGKHFTQEIRAGKHKLFSDKEEAAGGGGKGPGPYDYLLAALGS